jgi:hypothetical protein
MKITKTVVDRLKPGERDVFAWDGETKGFGVRCRPTGAKVYLLKTAIKGRVRWLTPSTGITRLQRHYGAYPPP